MAAKKKKPAPKKKVAPKKKAAAPKKKAAAPKKKAAAPKKKAAAPKKKAAPIVQEVFFEAPPSVIYRAYLDPKQHAEFTGAGAKNTGVVGGAFEAWDGYITGTNEELVENARIVQSWRTTEFPDEHPDSRLELLLDGTNGQTRLRVIHSGVPDDQRSDYEQGWHDHYWERLRAYLTR